MSYIEYFGWFVLFVAWSHLCYCGGWYDYKRNVRRQMRMNGNEDWGPEVPKPKRA